MMGHRALWDAFSSQPVGTFFVSTRSFPYRKASDNAWRNSHSIMVYTDADMASGVVNMGSEKMHWSFS